MEVQPQTGEDLPRQIEGRLGLGPGPAQDHGIVGIAHQRAAACRGPGFVEPVEVDVGQEGADHPALRRAGDRLAGHAVRHHPCCEPLPDQLEHPPVGHPLPDVVQQPSMVEGVEEAPDVQLGDPQPPLDERAADDFERRGRAPLRPIAEGDGQKSASKIGSSTSFAACCATRSRTVGMPSGRTPPSGFGMPRRRTGEGWYRPCRSASWRSWSMRSAPYSSTSARVSPAAPRLASTRRHASFSTSGRKIRSRRAWKRRSGDRLAATYSRRWSRCTLSTGGCPWGSLGRVVPAMP